MRSLWYPGKPDGPCGSANPPSVNAAHQAIYIQHFPVFLNHPPITVVDVSNINPFIRRYIICFFANIDRYIITVGKTVNYYISFRGTDNGMEIEFMKLAYQERIRFNIQLNSG